MPETNEPIERRAAKRCRKKVGMHCALLNQPTDQLVVVENFSVNGLYFASRSDFPPGAWLVLRSAQRNDALPPDGPDRPPSFTLSSADPASCAHFRSHTVARVQRCERIAAGNNADALRYGVGVQVQRLTD